MVGLFARAGTPPAIVDKLAAEAIAVVKLPATRKQMAAAGIELRGRGRRGLRQVFATEAAYVAR